MRQEIARVLEILKKKISTICDYLTQFISQPETLINEAMELDNEFSRFCLKSLINANSKKYNAKVAEKINTIFIMAVRENQPEKVKFLLDVGVNPNVSYYKNSALKWAVIGSKEDMVKLLLSNSKTNPNIQDMAESTPLMYAIIFSKENIARLLLNDSRVDPNVKSWNGNTALILAVANNKENIVKLLLNNSKTDPNIQNDKGRTALTIAIEKDDKNIAELIKKHLIEFNKK